jgi:transcription-repair coupling factor (superfamily II helicase)
LSTSIISKKYSENHKTIAISKAIYGDSKIQIKGLIGSSLSFVIQDLFAKSEQSFLLLCNEKEEAAYILNDLEQLIGDKDILFYPSSYRRPYQIEEVENANVLLRSEVLNRINSRQKPAIIVCFVS